MVDWCGARPSRPLFSDGANVNASSTAQGVGVVASFEGRDGPAARKSLVNRNGQLCKIPVFETETAERVAPMRVEAAADDDELRREGLGDSVEILREQLEVFRRREASLERAVERGATTLSGARFVGHAGARVVRVHVQRIVKHARVVVEDILGAVPVVYVPVDDKYVAASDGLEVAGGDRDVIEETESHCLLPRGVMPRRTNEAKRRLLVAAKTLFCRRDDATRSDTSCLDRAFGIDRVWIDSAPLSFDLTKRFEVSLAVASEYCFVGDGVCGLPAQARGEHWIGPERALNGLEAGAALRVVACIVLVKHVGREDRGTTIGSGARHTSIVPREQSV